MHLTRHTDYGLRVLMVLAANPGEQVPTARIADLFRISLDHLRKVVQGLQHAGFITTSRGRGGGIQLSRPASEIRLGAVVRALEPDMNVVECFGTGSACVLVSGCALKGVLAEARDAFLARLDAQTLAEAVAQSSRRGALAIS